MASKGEDKKPAKKPESVRERAERAINEAQKPSKKNDSSTPSKKISRLKLRRKNKENKKPRRFHIIPRYFRELYAELRQVTWPNRRDTAKLTTAVIVFAVVFAAFVGVVDYVFGIIFKKVFLHG